MSIIEVNDLSKMFIYHTKEEGFKNSIKNLFHRKKLEKNAVNQISFKINEGEIVGFLGANGAGKTTTLKMLSGIMYPTSGSAKVLNYIPWERKEKFKRQISIVMGQKNQLWWDLPASESLYLNKCIYELKDDYYRTTLDYFTNLLGVKQLLNVQVRRLSLGERMKFELIAALIHKPKVLFLDEPTIGLDILSQKSIRDFLKLYNKESNTTILLTSHYMNDIEDLCKRTIVISSGNLVYDGNLANIDEKIGNRKLLKIQFENNVSIDDINKIGYLREFNNNLATIEVNKSEIKEISQLIFKAYNIIDFNIENIPLEESISLLYKKGGNNYATVQ
ncbi:ABC transporter ATP-binding protein [Clostridium oryzae]|uniref:Putative ABC transporter ATP-binding protein YbhF n=1 Tax=Clostridium oryzae TaxID=1450648 RepID=A0A1V4IMT8_9CLOT|nr:ATP-binding cassette domain-containing protein [Clostridium oryzae]OPJ61193.1 putative ABC transporter ATP-binding protein YbhF [Clostridium oryzae]